MHQLFIQYIDCKVEDLIEIDRLLQTPPRHRSQAFQAGLVDQCHLFLAPVVVGGGKKSFPNHIHLELELLQERRFGNGMLYLHYRTRS